MNALERAYVLHAKPYGETSAILDLFTAESGRFNAVLRGVRSPKSQKRACMQPFTPILITFGGRGELQSINSIEAESGSCHLVGVALYSGFYLNELLSRLLPKFDAVPELFAHYEQVLSQLNSSELEIRLREFELHLLQEIGFRIEYEAEGEPLRLDRYYQFQVEEGFVLAPSLKINPNLLFLGEHLLKLEQQDWSDPLTKKTAKRLCRMALHPHLGGRPLNSSTYFATSRG